MGGYVSPENVRTADGSSVIILSAPVHPRDTGKVLTAAGSGTARWQTPTGGGGGGLLWVAEYRADADSSGVWPSWFDALPADGQQNLYGAPPLAVGGVDSPTVLYPMGTAGSGVLSMTLDVALTGRAGVGEVDVFLADSMTTHLAPAPGQRRRYSITAPTAPQASVLAGTDGLAPSPGDWLRLTVACLVDLGGE